MAEIVHGGTGYRPSHGELVFQLEQTRQEVQKLTRQVVKLRVILHRIIDQLPPERAARIRLEVDSARS